MKRNISDLAGSWDIGDEEVREIKKTLKKRVEDLEILCLDTDILIDFLRGETKTTKEVKKLEDYLNLLLQ